MTIRLKQPYLGRNPGDVVSTFDRGVCVALIQRNAAEEVKDATPPQNKMVQGGRIKKK